MLNKLAVFLTLPFLLAVSAHAQSTDLDRAADNINVISAKERIEAQKPLNKSLEVNLNNATKGQVSDIIKFSNQTANRAAEMENKPTPKPLVTSPENKKAVADHLKKDVKTYTYPKLYD